MASAALRRVAVTLGGRAALQAAKVAGRMPSRLVRTRPVTMEERKDEEMRYAKILAMKELLFDEIAQFRQEYNISRLHSWNNEMLLYPLSVEIKPRPGDTFRTNCRRIEILNRIFWLVGLFVSIDMAGDGFIWCVIKAFKSEGKEQLQNKENKMVSAAGA